MYNMAKKHGEPLPHFKKRFDNTEYFYLKNKLERLGFNSSDAYVILDSIDVSHRVCIYAATCDAIFNKLKNNPELFENTFGYSMYKKDNGKLKLNSSELLLDLYLFNNDKRNRGLFFETGIDGKKQRCLFVPNFTDDEMVNNFLKSKSSKFEYYGDYIFRNNSKTNRKSLNIDDLNNVIKKVDNAISKGKSLTMGVYSDEENPVIFRAMDENRVDVVASESEWGEGGGHGVCIIGKNRNGFIVSLWGSKYLISFSDLSHGRIDIHSSDIKIV